MNRHPVTGTILTLRHKTTDGSYPDGCFVIRRNDGLYWTGTAWARKRNAARCYTGVDPWQAADAQADELRRQGFTCTVAYRQPEGVERGGEVS